VRKKMSENTRLEERKKDKSCHSTCTTSLSSTSTITTPTSSLFFVFGPPTFQLSKLQDLPHRSFNRPPLGHHDPDRDTLSLSTSVSTSDSTSYPLTIPVSIFVSLYTGKRLLSRYGDSCWMTLFYLQSSRDDRIV
jgi:hypothetical protein